MRKPAVIASSKANKLGLCLIIASLFVGMLASHRALAAEPVKGIKVFCNGSYLGSTAYIEPTKGIAMIPIALIENIPNLRLDIDEQAYFAMNGHELITSVGSSRYTLDGQPYVWQLPIQRWDYGLAVPGRQLLEALGCQVRWDKKDRAVFINTPPGTSAGPRNAANKPVPLTAALLTGEKLWLTDMNYPPSQPVPVITSGVTEIVGWSANGRFLACLKKKNDGSSCDDSYLIIISSDNNKAWCVDEQPVVPGTVSWSPNADIIVYQTSNSRASKLYVLKMAVFNNEVWNRRKLLDCSDMISGLSWFPDGQSLALTWYWDGKNEPRPVIDRLSLSGKCACLFKVTLAATDSQKGIFPCYVKGMKLSPNGRYAACFEGTNSASLDADAMTLLVIDLKEQKTVFTANGVLSYPQWLAWSSDSSKLAFMDGTDRTASHNKHLRVIELNGSLPLVKDGGKPGTVDARPFWGSDGHLYYARGNENDSWLEEGKHQEVRVPGQRLWRWDDDTYGRPLTNPGPKEADYPLSLSPDGRFLAFLRLNWYDMGALYVYDTVEDKEIELVRDLKTDPGFYGNYYPDSVRIFWGQHK